MSRHGLIERTGKWLIAAGPFAAVAALGALVIHQLGYAMATATGQLGTISDHGHLTAQWAVLTPLAIVGAVVLVLRQIRNLGYRPCGPLPLAAASGVLFLVQEAVEGASNGSMIGGLLTVPVLAGLATAPLVAAVIVRLLSDVAEVVARFVTTPGPIATAASPFAPPVGFRCRPQLSLALAPSRGPPVSMR